jgi:hypothetical protein
MSIRSGSLRDHQAIVLEEFNGYWDRGGEEAVPIDHFDDAQNLQFIESGFRTRDGIDTFIPGIGNVVRQYNYKLQNGESLLILDTSGRIYHVLLDGSETVYGPILSLPAMEDFGFAEVAGRAFISPFEIYLDTDGVNRARGLQGEKLYVYQGDGTTARRAAGGPPIGSAMVAAQGPTGFFELGFHIFAVVYETDTGYLTAPGPDVFTTFTVVDSTKSITLSNVPISPNSFVTKRHIIGTKTIIDYNGDQDGYQLFFVPLGVIPDNTTTTINISAYDIDLLTDASHLIENFSEIPAGVGLSIYRNRLIINTEYDNVSLVRLSAPGEPEAINQVDGLIVIPLDGRNVTITQEFRDILYIFKQVRTYAVADNGDVPSSWSVIVVDQGIGCPIHGIAEVLDSGGVNIDMLLISDFSGIMGFNGTYSRPELSYKIQDFWLRQDRNLFHRYQILNDTIKQVIYFVMPDYSMLIGDYSVGLDPKNIKWMKWDFDIDVSSIALIGANRLILGALS